jgi:hypothetical protein
LVAGEVEGIELRLKHQQSRLKDWKWKEYGESIECLQKAILFSYRQLDKTYGVFNQTLKKYKPTGGLWDYGRSLIRHEKEAHSGTDCGVGPCRSGYVGTH